MRHHLTPEQLAEIRRLREFDRKRWSLNELAREFGISDTTVKRIIDPTFVDKRRNHVASNVDARTSPAYYRQRVEADAMRLAREIPRYDTRDLTGQFFGDPIPGDRRRA